MYHRDLLHRMHSEGHELANHGFHSVLFTDLSFEDIASNVLRTSGIISNVTNSQVKYFRPPKGNLQYGTWWRWSSVSLLVMMKYYLLVTCMHACMMMYDRGSVIMISIEVCMQGWWCILNHHNTDRMHTIPHWSNAYYTITTIYCTALHCTQRSYDSWDQRGHHQRTRHEGHIMVSRCSRRGRKRPGPDSSCGGKTS